MKKLALGIVVILLSFGARSAFPQCPTAPTVVTGYPGSVNYTQDTSCYTLTSGVSSTTVNCYFGSGWSFDGAYFMYATTSFAPASGYVINANNWSAGSFIEFNSPAGSAYDWIELAAYVQHQNNTVSQYSLFYWDGTMGTLSGCAQQYGLFSADVGDTVTIRLNSTNANGATIRASIPRIFNER